MALRRLFRRRLQAGASSSKTLSPAWSANQERLNHPPSDDAAKPADKHRTLQPTHLLLATWTVCRDSRGLQVIPPTNFPSPHTTRADWISGAATTTGALASTIVIGRLAKPRRLGRTERTSATAVTAAANASRSPPDDPTVPASKRRALPSRPPAFSPAPRRAKWAGCRRPSSPGTSSPSASCRGDSCRSAPSRDRRACAP